MAEIDGYQVATWQEIERDAAMVADFIVYFQWLASQDDRFPLTAGQVATFYHEYIDLGRYPSEVAEDLGLPVADWW